LKKKEFVLSRRRQNELKMKFLKALYRESKGRYVRKTLVYRAMNTWSKSTLNRTFSIWISRFGKRRALRESKLVIFLKHPKALRFVFLFLDQNKNHFNPKNGHSIHLDSLLIRKALNQELQRIAIIALKSLIYRDGIRIKKLHLRR
jgi:hypothetical protein